MSYTLPINNQVKVPSTSKAYENGKIPATILVSLPNVINTCRCDPTAARAFEALFAAAKVALAVEIKHSGDYRSFTQQLNLFVDRYMPVTSTRFYETASAHRKIWNDADEYGYSSVYWIKNYAKFGYWPATAATPGTSNHGRGLAIDVAEEYDLDSSPDPIREMFVSWLCDNAPLYGIYASLLSEPWHWQYVPGDEIPQAVLDYERGGPPQETDMIELATPLRAYDSRPGAPQDDVDPTLGGVNNALPKTSLAPQTYREVYVGYCNRAMVQVTYIAKGAAGFVRVGPAGLDVKTAAVGADTVDTVEYGPCVPVRTPGGKIRVKAGPGTCDFIVDVYATDTGL
jgi:hypothetical protein